MTPPITLWVDLTCDENPASLLDAISAHCSVQSIDNVHEIHNTIESLQPDIVCYDIDQPSDEQRALLQALKLRFPSIPILLFTSARSADIVMWAFRIRVWDCFIKPVQHNEVLQRINMLMASLSDSKDQPARSLVMPQSQSTHTETNKPARTATALRYININFCERIQLADAADICGMTLFEFSRAFKREQGLTFRDYILQRRIHAAALALRASDASILDVAFSVGFNDPSHFSRLFRRTMGVTPSIYRRTFTERTTQTD